MNRTLLVIRLVFFLLCGACGWLVCYAVEEWDSHRTVAVMIGLLLGVALGLLWAPWRVRYSARRAAASAAWFLDLMGLAAHKFYGPKGVGALYIRDGVKLEPLIHGAQHESGRRAGTSPVAQIVGMGTAAALARQSLATDGARLAALRDRLRLSS